MFLSKNYILANELIEKMGIHIANISILKQKLEDEDDFTTLKKLNSCIFIKSNSHKLTNTLAKSIAKNTFTDMSDKLPVSYVHSEYGLSERMLTNSGVIKGKITICGKPMYQFNEDFIKKVKGKITYVLNEEDLNYCLDKNQIDGYIKMAKNKFFVWY